jgi:predicted nucleic acid-binding protein
MKKFVLDTNVFIHAMRDTAVRAELATWQRAMAPHIYQHAVVVSELLVGARSEQTWRRWHARWVLPAERLRRVLVPSYTSWLRASRILARLAEQEHITPGQVKPGFYNDCLLAASSREEGAIVVTHNRADFDLIARAEPGLRTAPPFP